MSIVEEPACPFAYCDAARFATTRPGEAGTSARGDDAALLPPSCRATPLPTGRLRPAASRRASREALTSTVRPANLCPPAFRYATPPRTALRPQARAGPSRCVATVLCRSRRSSGTPSYGVCAHREASSCSGDDRPSCRSRSSVSPNRRSRRIGGDPRTWEPPGQLSSTRRQGEGAGAKGCSCGAGAGSSPGSFGAANSTSASAPRRSATATRTTWGRWSRRLGACR